MCVIVDTNSRKQFMDKSNKSSVLLNEWLTKRKGKLLLTAAYDWQREHGSSSFEWKAWVRSYSGAGIVRDVRAAAVEAKIAALPPTKSGEKDKHILALALAGGARLLYSADDKLCDDFKSIVPGGVVYPGAGGKSDPTKSEPDKSDPNSAATVNRCKKILNKGGLCGHGAS